MLKTKIFSTIDIKTQAVDVPEWGVTVHVKTLTGTERAALFAKFEELKKRHAEIDSVVWLVLFGTTDEQGNRLFDDADFPLLAAKSAPALDRIAQAVNKMNGFDAQAVDDAKKN